LATTRPDAEPGDSFEFCFLDFRPLAGCDGLRPVLRLAADAFTNAALLRACADPAAEAAADAAARALWGELELADATGRPVAGRVVWFLDHGVDGHPSYWLDVALDDAAAPVPAPVHIPPRNAPGYRPPAA
jgi:hypothetical protein